MHFSEVFSSICEAVSLAHSDCRCLLEHFSKYTWLKERTISSFNTSEHMTTVWHGQYNKNSYFAAQNQSSTQNFFPQGAYQAYSATDYYGPLHGANLLAAQSRLSAPASACSSSGSASSRSSNSGVGGVSRSKPRNTACMLFALLLNKKFLWMYISNIRLSLTLYECNRCSRGSWMCELWCSANTSLATRRYWTLSVQRLWIIPQNERTKSATCQAKETTGRVFCLFFFF